MKNLSKIIEKIEQGDAWDENDTVVELKIKQPLDKVIPIRLQEDHWRMLRIEAKELGIGPTTLARMWILERLRSNAIEFQDPLLRITKDRELRKDFLSRFTTNEYEILKLFFQGYPEQHIAKIMDIDPETIKKRIVDILQKLNPQNEILHNNTSENKVNIER